MWTTVLSILIELALKVWPIQWRITRGAKWAVYYTTWYFQSWSSNFLAGKALSYIPRGRYSETLDMSRC